MPLFQAVLGLASLHLKDEDVFDAFSVGSWLEVVAAAGIAHPLHFLLLRVLVVLNREAGQVLAIAFDLDPVADVKDVTLAGALLFQFGVVHVRLQRERPALLQAGQVVVLPGQSLVDFGEVLDKLANGHRAKLCLQADVRGLSSSRCGHAIHLHTLCRLVLILPVGAVQVLDEGVGRFTAQLDVLCGLLV